MAGDIFIFKRIEKKYMLTDCQYSELLSIIGSRLSKDKYHRNTICNIYLDTPEFLIIRNSIEATVYKEKLRLRSYGTPKSDSQVFLEIKKKYKGIVYKRRISTTLAQAEDYIFLGKRPLESQIMNEIDYSMKFYHNPQPKVVLCYEREAYFATECPSLRITFDFSPRYRADDLYLEHGSQGKEILPCNTSALMEIKTDGSMPLWLAEALDECKILPSSFSKYGTAYKDLCLENKTNQTHSEGEYIYA